LSPYHTAVIIPITGWTYRRTHSTFGRANKKPKQCAVVEIVLYKRNRAGELELEHTHNHRKRRVIQVRKRPGEAHYKMLILLY